MTDRTLKLITRIGIGMLVAGVLLGGFLLLRSRAPHGPLVVVDAGHGGEFSNTGIGGLKEDDLNLSIAKKLRKKLLSRGYRVIMTRTSDSEVAEGVIASWRTVGAGGVSWLYGVNKSLTPPVAATRSDLQARVDAANTAGADVFISVHNNASKDASVRGTETYAYRGDAAGTALAASVQNAVVTRSGSQNRGSHGSGLYVCRWTNMPAVLVEGAYFTNKEDAKALKSSRFQNQIAEGIVDGIDRWIVSYPLRAKEPQVAASDSAALACAVSAKAYPHGSRAVVVLPAETTALGASASALAAKLGCPLLLASGAKISPQTAAELRRLEPARVVVVGISGATDVAALGAAITEATGARARIDTVAENTAPAAAAQAAGWIALPASGEVAVVDAADTAALTALAPYVARKRIPVLLSEGGQLDQDGLAFLSANRGRVKRVIAVGCASAPAQPEGVPVTLLRFADSDQLAARLLARTDSTGSKRSLVPVAVDAAIAPDSFVAATEAAHRKQPLVQFREGLLGAYSREFLVNRSAHTGHFLILRDAGSISPVAENALRKSVGR